MSWNYRVIVEDGQLHIGEVYYNDSGKPIATHERPSYVYGSTVNELKAQLALFQEALDKPILRAEEIGEQSGKQEVHK